MIKKVASVFLTVYILLFTRVCATNLEEIQETQIEKLGVVGEKVVDLLEQLDAKVGNQEISNQLVETQQEVSAFVEQQQELLSETTSTEEIRSLLEETKKRIILKTYDGVTDHDPLTETVQVPGGVHEQKEAVKTVLEVINQGTRKQVQIVTSKLLEEVFDELYSIDQSIQLRTLFVDGGVTYYELSFDAPGLFHEELFSDLDEGVLPDRVLSYKIVKPEVYTIGTLLSGEQDAELRGQRIWQTAQYHNFLRVGKMIRVAVIDTGIDKTHPDLASVISVSTPGYDFVNNDADPSDDHLHGTHVAGTIAAVVNGQGVYGVNPFVEIVPLKICTAQGYCPSYAITNAIKYAADNGIEVLNMSLGGFGSLLNNPTCAAIEYATQHGSIAVVAAGNANTNILQSIPGACPNTITVGAVDQHLTRASFSNYGEQVDISAPGVGIYSTIPGGGRKKLDGTSMATPHISAAVASVLSKTDVQGQQAVQTYLLNHTKSVAYESGKPIGPFLDYQALMVALGSEAPAGGEITGTGQLDVLSGSGDEQDISIEQSPEFTSSHTHLDLETGKTVLVTVSNGTPPYRISKENEFIGFAQKGSPQNGGVQIASVGLEALFTGGTSNSSLGENSMSPSQNEEDSFFSSLPGLLSGGNDEQITVASSSQEYSFRVLGLQPGKSGVTVTDALGKEVYISIDIETQVQKLTQNRYGILPNTYNDIYQFDRIQHQSLVNILFGRQYQTLGYPWSIKTSSMVGKGEVLFSVYNRHERRYQSMLLAFISATPSEFEEYEVVHNGSGVDANPLHVDNMHVELAVGEEMTLKFTGGRPGYMFHKGTGDFLGCNVADGGIIAGGSLRILGLKKGATGFYVSDMFGRKIQITVLVKEKVLWVKPGSRISLGGTNAWWQTKSVLVDALASTRLYYNGVWYIDGGLQEGVSFLRHRIFNTAEQQEQELVYTLRVGWTLAVEPLRSSFTEKTLAVGDVVTLRISGGTPKYTIKKSNQNIGFAEVRGAGSLQIASAGSSETDVQILVDGGNDDYQEFSGSTVYSGEENSVDEPIDEVIQLSSHIVDDVQIAGVTQSTYDVYIIGLLPGESTITLIDNEGTQKTISLTVKEKVITGALGTEKGWYYLDPNRLYEVRGIRTDTPAIVSTRVRRNTYSYTMLRDGVTSLTLQLRNAFEKKYQEMRYTMRSGNPSTLDCLVESGTIAVGDVTWVHIQGGGGPYTIKKSNDHVGLGYEHSDMTSIASIPDEHKIILPEGTDKDAEVVSGTGFLSTEQENILSGWTDEDRAVLDTSDPSQTAMYIAGTTGTNSQVFRVVGLTSGTTVLEVKDVYGEIQSIPITVEPKHIDLTSAYVGGTYRAPYNPNYFVWFMHNKRNSSITHAWWSVTSLRPTIPQVVGYLNRGHYAPYYLYGISNGTTDLEVSIYNPHERKQQTMVYSVSTTGMNASDLQALLARYVVDNQSDGPVSSINQGGGGFGDEEGVGENTQRNIIDANCESDGYVLGNIICNINGSGIYEIKVSDSSLILQDRSISVQSLQDERDNIQGTHVNNFEKITYKELLKGGTYAFYPTKPGVYNIDIKDVQNNQKLSYSIDIRSKSVLLQVGKTLSFSLTPNLPLSIKTGNPLVISNQTVGNKITLVPSSVGKTDLTVLVYNPKTKTTEVAVIPIEVVNEPYLDPENRIIQFLKGENDCVGYFCSDIFGQFDQTDKVFSILSKAWNDQSISNIYDQTSNGGDYDLKRSLLKDAAYIENIGDGYVYIVGQRVHVSNLGNLLVGFNIYRAAKEKWRFSKSFGLYALYGTEVCNYSDCYVDGKKYDGNDSPFLEVSIENANLLNKPGTYGYLALKRAYWDEYTDMHYYYAGFWLAQQYYNGAGNKFSLGISIMIGEKGFNQAKQLADNEILRIDELAKQQYPGFEPGDR